MSSSPLNRKSILLGLPVCLGITFGLGSGSIISGSSGSSGSSLGAKLLIDCTSFLVCTTSSSFSSIISASSTVFPLGEGLPHLLVLKYRFFQIYALQLPKR